MIMKQMGGRRRKHGGRKHKKLATDMHARMAQLRAMRGKSLAAPYGGRRRRGRKHASN